MDGLFTVLLEGDNFKKQILHKVHQFTLFHCCLQFTVRLFEMALGKNEVRRKRSVRRKWKCWTMVKKMIVVRNS